MGCEIRFIEFSFGVRQSTDGNQPRAGDILRMESIHVAVAACSTIQAERICSGCF